MKRTLIASAVIACSVLMGTSSAMAEDLDLVFECDKTEGFVIGYSNGYWGNTWRAQMVEDFEKRAEEYKESGVISDVMISNTNNDPTEQLNQINAMIDAGVDAIIIDAVSPTTIKSAVEKAQHEGEPSVSAATTIPGRRSRRNGWWISLTVRETLLRSTA